MDNNEWKDSWKDNWKGPYQNKDDFNQAKTFYENNATKDNKAKGGFIKRMRNMKQKKDESLFMNQQPTQSQVEKDYELIERAEQEGNSVIVKALIGKAITAIIVIVILLFIVRRI